MASIRIRDGKKTIRWRCPVRGTHRQYTPKDQQTKWVRQLVREIERCCDLGEEWVAPSARAPQRAGLDIVVAAVLRDRARALKPSTVNRLRIVYGQFLDSLWWVHGEKTRLTVEHFSRQALADYYEFLTMVRTVGVQHGSSGRAWTQTCQCSPSTAAPRVRTIEDLWERVADHDLYGEGCPRPRRLRDLPRRVSSKRPVPTWAEMDAAVHGARPVIIKNVRHGADWLYRLFFLQRFLGLRSGQVRRLTWADFDLDGASLRIRPVLGKSNQEQQGRVIPISAHLVTELASWSDQEGLVVKSVHDTAVRTMARRAWRRGAVREEVWAATEERRGQQTHAFRHGFITGLRSAGVDLSLIHYLVGHRDQDIADTYTYWALMEPQLRAAVAKIPPLSESGTAKKSKKRRE